MKPPEEPTLALSRTNPSDAVQEPSGAAVVAEEMPENLRKSFCDVTLVAWIEDEIKRFKWNHPQEAPFSQDHADDDSALTASVLSFAFVSGMFASEDIVRACRFDPVFYRLSNGRLPFQQQLCTFRRENRPMLVQVLTGVFKRAITRKLGLSAPLLPKDIARVLHDHAVERLDLARHMDTMDTAQGW